MTDVCSHGRPDHQELIAQLCEALGLPGPPQAKSPQQVFEECLTECCRLYAQQCQARSEIGALRTALRLSEVALADWERSYPQVTSCD